MLSRNLDLKTAFSLQYGKLPSIIHDNIVIKWSEVSPKHGNSQVNFLLGIMKLRSVWINNLFKSWKTE